MIKPIITSLAGLVFFAGVRAQQSAPLVVSADDIVAEIQPTMYGIFFEDINFAADGGLYAELVKNRSFEFTFPLMGWSQPNSDRHSLNENSGFASVLRSNREHNPHFCRVEVKNDKGYSLINEGFRGMGIKEGETYNLSLMAAKHEGNISRVHFRFVDESGKVLGETSIQPGDGEWKKYKTAIIPTGTAAKAQLKITFEGKGTIDLDMISVFPEETWKNRPNGLRKDLVQLLYDMDPGFLRFPGGCIVEGRTLNERYQWKKTVGPIEDREGMVNRWNMEFEHRLTPDYYQSFGLGFFEYFQLAEDLGAEPLPILSCGIACQFNTGELAPMDELDPYIQDALDLIEFANGPVNSSWGKIRKDMGHPEPFNMKYIGVGNEQWGPEYIKRYKVFEKAIKEKYPDMIIVSGSGPFPDGEYFEYGMKELKKLNAEIIDEHYYRSPEWFRENADRYDSYDRNGPKIFAGEYAAQSVAIASPENRNNWECALSEAAFITGLERNAEVVHLTSYAPLMAHKDGWQWTPDLIWFDNLGSYGTPNYYVQKLFSRNKGTHVVPVRLNGKAITGQGELYATASLDKNTNEIIVKIVNTSGKEKQEKITFRGVSRLADTAKITVLQTGDLAAENSLDHPVSISPKEKSVKAKKDRLDVALQPYSVNVIRVKKR
ncbi:alpha-L-arabinofuranosidase C-terminal domain-containing protein [Sinomicrobium weinanense]|uniref:non-reducing end alpha-L-arabinofuranosidase n=1 Tax=Sinomicrobium weinanense TaxID=2842200 RepID=A0A926JQK7_9FLAO|nr:alpha-L-arabinofuranosidase C-terminal domain-containing protein [Sinomicrobium weinanense]MBC9795665.1 alpha-L-arabinofuranosidase [Sinomicrobium weinanense]MBU3122834.1 alpha-L-arabinofuranosidase [Sinomicrobium weinanense]